MKKLIKPFLIVFLISFLIINWNDVSWLFNYKFISRAVSDFFQKETKITSNLSQMSQAKITNFEFSEKENSLEIPKIEILAPLIFVSNENEVYKALDRGVVHFPDSVLPDQIGQTVILGHSSPPNWPKIKYDWIFSRLSELNEGDEISVYLNNGKYEYIVTRKVFLEKGEEVSKDDLTNNKNVLVLISCWPLGKDIRRIAVEAVIKK